MLRYALSSGVSVGFPDWWRGERGTVKLGSPNVLKVE